MKAYNSDMRLPGYQLFGNVFYAFFTIFVPPSFFRMEHSVIRWGGVGLIC